MESNETLQKTKTNFILERNWPLYYLPTEPSPLSKDAWVFSSPSPAFSEFYRDLDYLVCSLESVGLVNPNEKEEIKLCF